VLDECSFSYVADSLERQTGMNSTFRSRRPTASKGFVKVKAFVVAASTSFQPFSTRTPFKAQSGDVNRNLHQSHARAPDIKVSYRRASIARNTRAINATRTRGRGSSWVAKGDRERNSVVATAQLVVASIGLRQTLLRYISPRYR